MSERVKVQAHQEFTHTDVERLQTYRIEQVDNLVRDAIHAGKTYSGFQITQSGASRIVVGRGALRIAGQDYNRPADTDATFDFASGTLTLPVSQMKYFSMVGWGSTREIDVQPREFEIAVQDASGNYTGEYTVEQRDVATTVMRYANIDIVQGLESANPQPPTIDSASQIEIARILCGPTGIISITHVEGNRLETLQEVAARLRLQELFSDAIRSTVDSLISDFGSLRKLVDTLPRGTTIDQLVRDVARLKEDVGRDDTATMYGAITFGHAGEMDLTHAQSMCRIDGALGFPAASIKEALLTFANPNEPAVKAVGSITLPDFEHVLALDTTAGLNIT